MPDRRRKPRATDAPARRVVVAGEPRPVRLRATRWCAFLAGLLHAAFMVAAFPPFDLWGFSLVAMAPLVWLVSSPRITARSAPGRHGSNAGESKDTHPGHAASPSSETHSQRPSPSALIPAMFAGVGTIPFHAFEHRWLWDVAGPGYPLLVLLLAGFPAFFVWVMLRLRRRAPRLSPLVLAPILWGGLEFFRGSIAFDGYPWFFVGHPLVSSWPLAAPAAVVGAFGVSFLASVAGSIAGWFLACPSRPRVLQAVGAGVGLAGVWAGLSLAPPLRHVPALPDRSTIRVGVVQTNIPQSTKMDWTPAQRIEDLLWFLELTEQAARPPGGTLPPDLIVWPETMFPGTSLDPAARRAEEEAGIAWRVERPSGEPMMLEVGALARELLDRQRDLGVPMLVGAVGHENLRYTVRPDGLAEGSHDALHNSVFVLHAGEVGGRYDKLHLTPFGEVMPYISAWPWLERQLLVIAARGMRFQLSAGSRTTILSVPLAASSELEQTSDQGPPHRPDSRALGPEAETPQTPSVDPSPTDIPRAEPPGPSLRAMTPICFESTSAEVCRRLFLAALEADGPDTPVIMVNPTNDGWFGDNDAGREQHLQLARWRAIELGVPVVRAANTGISCAIDPRGRVVARGVLTPEGARADSRADGVLMAELRLPEQRTIYARVGDLLGWIVLAVGGLLCVVGFWPITRARPQASRPTRAENVSPIDR